MKTQQEAEKMAKKITKAMLELPDVNFFGDSNDDNKREMCKWIFAFGKVAAGATETGEPEVDAWLTGNFSVISDFG